MNKKSIQEQLEILEGLVTNHKKTLIDQVLQHRTRHLTIALEDIFQPHNTTATLRTAECLGIQDIHVIENRNAYRPSPQVAQGSGKWVNLHRYHQDLQTKVDLTLPEQFPTHNTQTCLNHLKSQGYRLIATAPDQDSITLDELDISQPTAFLFGTEAHGLTEYAFQQADATLRLPMVGFTQSYNISVSVAITLAQACNKLWGSDIDWRLNELEQAELRLDWYKKCVKNAEAIISSSCPPTSNPSQN